MNSTLGSVVPLAMFTNDYYNTMTMMMTMTLCGGGCGEAEDMRDAFEVSSISSNSDQNTALNSETIHC